MGKGGGTTASKFFKMHTLTMSYNHTLTRLIIISYQLLEIQANANAGRAKQKTWARKAMVKSEIEACWVRSYWKQAAVRILFFCTILGLCLTSIDF